MIHSSLALLCRYSVMDVARSVEALDSRFMFRGLIEGMRMSAYYAASEWKYSSLQLI
jgi:hypothetical protein